MSSEGRRSALVVRGGWAGHHPVEATELFLPFLDEHGFAVQIHESPEVYADAGLLAAQDLVVQCVTMAQLSNEALAGLRAAVAGGLGLVGWHGGIADSFRDQADYLQLIGGQFAAHPSIAPERMVGDESDNFLHHRVELTDAGRAHPVTAGLDDFELHTEQYWVLHDDLIEVLASTEHPAPPWQPWRRPVVSPVVWTRHWCSGRIVVATPGHDLAVLQDANVRTIIERGMLWASRTA